MTVYKVTQVQNWSNFVAISEQETPASAIIRFRAFCTLRDFAANALFLTASLPWDFNFSPRWVAVISAIGTAIGGRIYSLLSFFIFAYTIRSTVHNTRAYQVIFLLKPIN